MFAYKLERKWFLQNNSAIIFDTQSRFRSVL